MAKSMEAERGEGFVLGAAASLPGAGSALTEKDHEQGMSEGQVF